LKRKESSRFIALTLQPFNALVIMRRMDLSETIETTPQGELVTRTVAMPKDTNPNGDIFGGWLMSQMDLGSGILASKTAKARVVTAALDGMSFLQPVRVGDTVACYARVESIGRSSMKIPVEVWVQRYRRTEQTLVTRAVFTYVAVDQSGRPIPVQRDP
jgi:acyl-CoA thioesterase YciA